MLDSSIANVATPAISDDVGGGSPSQDTWVITSFGVANASVPLSDTAQLSAKFGARTAG